MGIHQSEVMAKFEGDVGNKLNFVGLNTVCLFDKYNYVSYQFIHVG